MKQRLPIGISDYKEIVEDNYAYIDKTLLIKQLIEDSGKATLLPRPRRFGKTLNISMLQYFFEKTDTDHSHLFKKTNIWKEKHYHNLQGKFPVISLSLRHVKELSWEKARDKIITLISQEFDRHKKAIDLSLLSTESLKSFSSFLSKHASETDYTNSLYFLCKVLSATNNSRVIILIDEYDAPIHASYINGYYKEMINFIKNLLTDCLKDNSYLEKGVLTGILRTAKESIFSGLNNLSVYTLLDEKFSNKFGFTQDDTENLLDLFNLTGNHNMVKDWYNGYQFGSTLVYNPWSILNYLNEEGRCAPYWSNTSDNAIIKKLIAQADSGIKQDFEILLQKKALPEKAVEDGVVFSNLDDYPHSLWSFLLFSGYLTQAHYRLKDGINLCKLVIPNHEVLSLFRKLITKATQETLISHKINQLLTALTTGDKEALSILLQEFVANSMSVHDLPASKPERGYHLFVLGLLVLLEDTYHVRSNRESGFGRYDIMLIPIDTTKAGVIIEFKKVWPSQKTTLEDAAQNALEQIQSKNYKQELVALGITKIYSYGIAFKGKKLALELDASN